MSTKFSLHIGLNRIDLTKYKGKYDPLNNAEYDAKYYSKFAKGKGFNASQLIGNNATSSSFFSEVDRINKNMKEGDLFFLSFSGHGTRVKDINSDEKDGDGYDEALVLYDRIILDDELRNIWGNFNNKRIFFLSDSCYNGKVSRFFSMLEESFAMELSKNTFRGVDISNSEIDFEENLGFYSGIKLFQNKDNNANYSLIHIASCQNNQLADDGSKADKASYFTSIFKKVLDDNNFSGDYKKLYNQLSKNMPPWQSPSWDNHNESSNFEKTSAFE